jgi:hypothetical protein
MRFVTRHVISNLCRGLLGWLVLFLAAGALKAQYASYGSPGGYYGRIEVTGVTKTGSDDYSDFYTISYAYSYRAVSDVGLKGLFGDQPLSGYYYVIGAYTAGSGAGLVTGNTTRSGGVAKGSTQFNIQVVLTHGSSPLVPVDLNQVTRKVRLRIFNDKNYPVTYQVLQDGNVIETITQAARSGQIREITVPSTAVVSVIAKVDGLLYDAEGGSWVLQEGAVFEAPVAGGIEPKIAPLNPDTDTKDVGQPNTPTEMPTEPSPTGTNQSGLPVWKKETDGENGTQGATQTDLFTNATYRQGVDKIVQKMDTAQKALDEHNEAVLEEMNRRKTEEMAAKAANPDSSAMSAAGAAASTAEKSSWGTVALTAPTVTGSPPVFLINEPFTGKVFDMNPFRSDRLGGVASWLRSLAVWLIVAAFAIYAVHVAGDTIRDVASSQQAKGNSVVAGTGAQATALIAAGLISLVVLGVVVAMAAWKDTALTGSGGSIISVLGFDPFASAPAACVWMIDQVWPITTFLAAILARITFKSVATLSYIGAAAVIRFIVP